MLKFSISFIVIMGDKMAGKEEVKYMLKVSNTTAKELARMLEINEQSMHNKLYRNSFTYEEILHIADLLGFDIKTVKRN